jgi:hypothetical protein
LRWGWPSRLKRPTGCSSLDHDALQSSHGGIGIDGVGDQVTGRLGSVFVDHVGDLERPALRGHVELVVEGPDVVGMGGPEPIGRLVEVPRRWRL